MPVLKKQHLSRLSFEKRFEKVFSYFTLNIIWPSAARVQIEVALLKFKVTS
jgi:hypothetical protein